MYSNETLYTFSDGTQVHDTGYVTLLGLLFSDSID